MIDISLKKPEVRLLLKVLNGPSVTDPKVAELYERLKAHLDDAAPTAPWCVVVRAGDSAAYRGNGVATTLFLSCGHSVREAGVDAREIRRGMEKGVTFKRRCHECAGGHNRRAAP